MPQAERGLFEMIRGRPVWLVGDGSSALLAPVEGLSPESLELLRDAGTAPVRISLTTHRALSMGLVTGEKASINGRPGGVSLPVRSGWGVDEIVALASSRSDGAVHSNGLRPAADVEVAGLILTRLARLLPAVVSAPGAGIPSAAIRPALDSGAILRLGVEEVRALVDPGREEVRRVTEGPVPLEGAEEARFVLYREGSGLFEHVAVLIGDPTRWPRPVPIRLHSACLTGDLFGSLRCDCGEQLRTSLRAFKKAGGGVLVYLAHEGRSIGLGNKLRAYSLQEQGLDTVDADCVLGFGPDERSYLAAVAILKDLGVTRTRLFTNNPEKVAALERGGIEVVVRESLQGAVNRHNQPYLDAKARRSGHWLDGTSLPDDSEEG